MNGAETLVVTLLEGGVKVCFANPGTSEMHFVAALDRYLEMRCVLCLFEGGATGAADGYFRMSGEIAATLLHLAPGFGNGFANLHTARKAGSGMLTIVGDHAIRHMAYESPLKGDVPGLSRTISHVTRQAADSRSVASEGAAAIRAARANNGQLATLILPADTAWDEAGSAAGVLPSPPLLKPSADKIAAAANRLREPGAALLIDGPVLFGERAHLAAAIAAKAGCRLLAPLLVSRIRRGAGAARIDRLAYAPDDSAAILADVRHLVMVGADRPTNFFAYPGKPSLPEAHGTTLIDLASRVMDLDAALEGLAAALGVVGEDRTAQVALDLPDLPSGPMDLARIGQAFAHLLPEDAIVVDEGITVSRHFMAPTEAARGHDWLHTTGGAIGFGLPNALGAAIACPDRKVVALSGDGSAMYTLQALWTMARERLDVTVIVFANRGYQILRGELANVGVDQVGRNARAMFDVEDPLLDWVALAKGHGVRGIRAEDVDGFNAAFSEAMAGHGPVLIEVVC